MIKQRMDTLMSLVFIVFLASLSSVSCGTVKRVLVFGGNGLIGAASVDRMLEQGHELTLVTRGNWYWDTEETIKPRVNHVKCDRMKKLRDCWAQFPEYFDAIVDFSGFDPYMIKDAIEVFKGKYDQINSNFIFSLNA